MNAKEYQQANDQSPQAQIGPRSMDNWKDRLGIFTSVACAIHCAITPVLIATLPALKLTEWMASPLFHQIAAVVCCAIVVIAIVPTFLRFRDYRILSLSSLGLGLILSAAFFGPEDCCSHDLTQAKSAVAHIHDEHNHDEHNHAHEHADSHASHEPQVAAMQMAGIGTIQPWMTPLGGVLLIAAHGLNLMRRRCVSPNCPNHA